MVANSGKETSEHPQDCIEYHHCSVGSNLAADMHSLHLAEHLIIENDVLQGVPSFLHTDYFKGSHLDVLDWCPYTNASWDGIS
jgi:hypothetical protein